MDLGTTWNQILNQFQDLCILKYVFFLFYLKFSCIVDAFRNASEWMYGPKFHRLSTTNLRYFMADSTAIQARLAALAKLLFGGWVNGPQAFPSTLYPEGLPAAIQPAAVWRWHCTGPPYGWTDRSDSTNRCGLLWRCTVI